MEKKLLFLLFCCIATIAARAQSAPDLIPYLDGQKWGYADSNGKVKIEAQWEYVGFFSNGRAQVSTNQSTCVIDTRGQYIIPPYRHWNTKLFSSMIGAYYNAKGKNGKYGIIDANNREIIPCVYDKTEYGNGFTSSGYFTWDKNRNKYVSKAMKNGKMGLIDTLNNVLIPFEYDGIAIDGFPFSSPSLNVVHKKKKMGVIDHHNREIVPCKYRNIWLDAENPNQIKLFKERGSVIADSNGKIALEIPRYELEFPSHSLIPVRDSAGKYGLMNYSLQLVIPCDYLSVGLRNNTIIVSQWMSDSNKKNTQHFRYHDIHSYEPISNWITYRQLMNLPEQSESKPPELRKNLAHTHKMRVQGKTVEECRIENIVWAAIAYPKYPEYLIPVKGIADGDTVANYAAVIDSNGNYVVKPQYTTNKINVINATDSLVLVQTSNRDSFQAVCNYEMKVIMPYQQYSVAAAFYHDGTFYAVINHTANPLATGETLLRQRTYQAEETYYSLATATGEPSKKLKPYKLHWNTDKYGIRVKHFPNEYRNEDGFNLPFKGYFMAEDSTGRRGIVSINGDIQLPSISFKYYQIEGIDPEIYKVNNDLPKQPMDYLLRLLASDIDDNVQNEKQIPKGLPYLVNSQNKVLLDSLSIEDVLGSPESGIYPLYNVVLKRPKNFSSYDISFLMNSKGHGFYGNLPKVRGRNR